MANVRDFIINDTITVEEDESKPKRKRNSTKPTIEYEVVLQDGPDGVIRRKTKTTSKILVLLMTQRQFYIKDEKSGEVKNLTAPLLKNFLKNLGEPLQLVPWCGAFCNGRTNAEDFCNYIKDEAFCWCAMRDMAQFKFTGWNETTFHYQQIMDRLDNPVFKSMYKMLSKTHDDEFMKSMRDAAAQTGSLYYASREKQVAYNILTNPVFNVLTEKFSIDVARSFAEEYMTAPYIGIDLPDWGTIEHILDTANFKPSRFIEYALYESVRQGYAILDSSRQGYYNPRRTFFEEWKDVLDMQVQIRGKVYDKYPKDLSSMHRALSFKVQLFRQAGDKKKFEERFELLKEHGKKDDIYMIRPPFNAEDIINEAQQQANCLASYVEPYMNGVTDVYFMRRLIDPDASLVTVEVRDGAIRQAYRASNRKPSDEEIAWLNEWAEENGFVGVPESYYPMCV